MDRDVFLSHSSCDAHAVESVRAALEGSGIRCWIAPRDVPAGSVWAEAIMDGIRSSRVFLLLFTRRSNESREVLREVDAAARAKSILLPVRLEDVLPSGALEFYVNTSQWFDAIGPTLDARLPELVDRIRELLGRPREAVTVTPPRRVAAAPSRRARSVWIGAGVAAVAAAITYLAVRGPGPAPMGPYAARLPAGRESTGGSATPEFEPAWARVSDEQRREARRLGVPVAYENGLGMRFVLIPAGRFTMGPGPGKPGKLNSGPAHEVTLAHAFYMQVTEVTNRQFRAFRPEHSSGDRDGASLDGDDQPVVAITQNEAVSYAGWVTERERRTYRLPTEAQWEYACRAGSKTRFFWGDDEGEAPRYANFGDRSSQLLMVSESLNDGNQVSAAVGSYLPNPWGLYDMHGNVWEWCSDWLAPYEAAPQTDPVGAPSSGTTPFEFRVVRGGAWDAPLIRLESAERHGGKPTEAAVTVFGFRICTIVPGQR